MKNSSFWNRLTHLDSYNEQATQTAFLLGGIGTGNVSLGSRGEFKDWELFNTPGKGNRFPYTFFSLHINNGKEGADRIRHNRVMEGPIQPPHSLSHGYDSADLAGLPRMQHSEMRAEYPLCAVKFFDDHLPVESRLEAYTPFIPLDDEDSALPIAILRYRIKNTSRERLFVSVAGSMANMSTFAGYGDFGYVKFESDTQNKRIDKNGLQGILFDSVPESESQKSGMTLSMMTPNPHASIKPTWYLGAWYDGAQDFWDDFSDDGLLNEETEIAENQGQILFQARQRVGSVAAYAWLEPGQEEVFEFYVTWHKPERKLSWSQQEVPNELEHLSTRNYYSLRFKDSFDVADYTHKNLDRLESLTYAFHESLFDSTLPDEVLDAISSNITVLRSTTCFRIEDGSFFGWEGCFNGKGCCDGNCTHVWNYAQTLAFLFPKLEQSMRINEFELETKADGEMNFRSRIKLQDSQWTLPPAIDGQCGSIVRLYREWMISGDDGLLERLGKTALKALDFVIHYWDQDGDGIPDSRQHNTYDIEFYGPNPLSSSIFLAAIKAGALIAKQLGDELQAKKLEDLFNKSRDRVDAVLWGTDYYIQQIPNVNVYPYQHGKGCLSDQLIGQFLAHVSGLGYILPRNHVKTALKSIYKYNFKKNLSEHENVQRCFALNDEAGLILCTWPNGGKPRFPFVYSNEVWTGIEFEVAALLMYEGMVEEGLDIVRAARNRHDGYKRNPFNEVECGHHYARSMSSWALLLAISGFEHDVKTGSMKLNPRMHKTNFRSFFSNGTTWGVCRQWENEAGETKQQFDVVYDVNNKEKNSSSTK